MISIELNQDDFKSEGLAGNADQTFILYSLSGDGLT